MELRSPGLEESVVASCVLSMCCCVGLSPPRPSCVSSTHRVLMRMDGGKSGTHGEWWPAHQAQTQDRYGTGGTGQVQAQAQRHTQRSCLGGSVECWCWENDRPGASVRTTDRLTAPGVHQESTGEVDSMYTVGNYCRSRKQYSREDETEEKAIWPRLRDLYTVIPKWRWYIMTTAEKQASAGVQMAAERRGSMTATTTMTMSSRPGRRGEGKAKSEEEEERKKKKREEKEKRARRKCKYKFDHYHYHYSTTTTHYCVHTE